MTIFNVSNATELKTALAGAAGGDRIVLADGNYGKLTISNRNYASAVTIESATKGGAHVDGLFVSGSKNLNFVGLDMGRALNAGEPTYTQLSSISNSSNVKLDSVNVHGSLDGNPANDGAGLTITNVTGLTVSNSHFEDLYRGIVLQKSSNLTIQNNEITGMRSDGIISTANDGVSIEGNHIGQFQPAVGDHADAIQFWNTGQTKGQTNITIKDNVIYQSLSGLGMQGIFISDPLTYGYKNVLIQNNLLYSNDQYNGIFVYGASGLQILDNTVTSKSTDNKTFWIRLMHNDHITLAHNVTDNIITSSLTDFTQEGNINFATNKAARALLPNLANPTGVEDLISATDVGYHAPITTPTAPVSGAIGNALGVMLTASTSAHAATIADSPATATAKSALVSAQPVVQDTHVSATPHIAAAVSTSPTLDLSAAKVAAVSAATPHLSAAASTTVDLGAAKAAINAHPVIQDVHLSAASHIDAAPIHMMSHLFFDHYVALP